MAAFVMQVLGCEVASLNTVHFSMMILQFSGYKRSLNLTAGTKAITQDMVNGRELKPPHKTSTIFTKASSKAT